MKRVVLVVALLAVPTLVPAAISTSKHNLVLATNTVYTNDTNQICQFCHVPHNARTTTGGLWNRGVAAVNFTWADTTTVGGTNLPSAASASSARCFTCHDGTSNIGTIYYPNTTFAMLGADQTGGVLTNTAYVVSPGAMSGNHPVSIRYPAAGGDGQYNSTATGANVKVNQYTAPGTLVNVRAYQDAGGDYGIECGSCHEPHDTTNTKFLRDSLANSQICTRCHIK